MRLLAATTEKRTLAHHSATGKPASNDTALAGLDWPSSDAQANSIQSIPIQFGPTQPSPAQPRPTRTSSLLVMESSCTRGTNLQVSQQMMTGAPAASAVMATVAAPTRDTTVPFEFTAAAPSSTCDRIAKMLLGTDQSGCWQRMWRADAAVLARRRAAPTHPAPYDCRPFADFACTDEHFQTARQVVQNACGG